MPARSDRPGDIGYGRLTMRRLAPLAAITGVGLALRAIGLDLVPAGLSHDEAYDALNALDVLAGKWPIFFEANNGREALFMYLVAGSFSLLGVGIVPLRIVAVLAGTAVIPLVYLLGQRLFDRRVGLLAAALVACSFWPIFDSRVGLRASLIPPLTCALTLTLLAWQRQPARAVPPIAAGILLGLSLNTYTPARVLPLVPIALGIWMVARQALPWQTVLRGLVFLGSATVVTASPLIAFFVAHPASFAERAGQVNDFRFILSEGDFGPLLRDTLNTLGMFTFGGDPFDRYNLAGRPVFDPLAGLGFYAGLLASPALLVIWLVVGLLPSATTGESPHFLRAIAAQPAIYLIAARGLWLIADRLPLRAKMRSALIWTAVLLGLTLTLRDYYIVWNNSSDARRIYGAATVAIARALAEGEPRTFVAAEYPADLDRFVVDVARGLRRYDATWFDGRTALVLPEAGPGRYFVPDTVRPPPEIVDRYLPGLGRSGTDLAMADLDASWRISSASPRGRLGDFAELLGVDAPAEGRPGEIARVTLTWRVIAPPPADLSFFVHAIGGLDALWAQNDGLGYPTDQWQIGDTLVHWHDVEVQPGTPRGQLRLIAGGYRRGTGERIPFRQGADLADRIVLGALEIPSGDMGPLPRPALPTSIAFGEGIRLEGFSTTRSGPHLQVSLFWRSVAAIPHDYTVFAHLVGDDPRPVAQSDGPPAGGMLGTSAWRPGELVRDRRALALPAGAGSYQLLIGLYRPETGERLAPLADPPDLLTRVRTALDRRFGWGAAPYVEGDRVVLARIRVDG